MRRRLTVAILLLVSGTLLLTSLVSFLLVRRAATNSAEQQLSAQAHALAGYLDAHPAGIKNATLAHRRRFLALVKLGGQFDNLDVVYLGPDGTLVSPLPAPLASIGVPTAPLASGSSVTGHVGKEVYAFVPLNLGTTASGIPVLVATRTAPSPVNGAGFFLLVALVALAVAAAVAAWLARRFSAPLVRAVDTTRRIASGDLEARIPVGPRDVPELDDLASSINAMGDNLVRARDQQRQFLLSVSHDLRTPLTSIRGYAEAIAEGATDDVTGALDVIASEARRLERLVGDLLDLARLDARRFSLKVAPVDVSDLVHQAVEGFRPAATASSLELCVVLPDAAPAWATTDSDRLRQVLSNLIENAFKYARREVAVGARRDAASVVLWVVDDGPGIAPEDLPRVFERHFRSDRSSAGRAGTGLGLAIVAELAAAMGGGAWAESPAGPDGGTRMVVQIPATAPALTAPGQR